MSVLALDKVTSGYGTKRVLNEVGLRVDPGEICLLLGHNAAGKSTLLKTIFGVVSAWSGSIRFGEHDLRRISTTAAVALGIGYVPQGGRVFGQLTILENLRLAAFHIRQSRQFRDRCDQVFQLFPVLHERRAYRAGQLSGGERQMLAIGMALMNRPRLLMLDEPSGGLAPIYVRKVFDTIRAVRSELQISIVLAEQNVRQALQIGDSCYVLSSGRVAYQSPVAEIDRQGDAFHSAFIGFGG